MEEQTYALILFDPDLNRHYAWIRVESSSQDKAVEDALARGVVIVNKLLIPQEGSADEARALAQGLNNGE